MTSHAHVEARRTRTYLGTAVAIALVASTASAQNHLLWRDAPTTGPFEYFQAVTVAANGDVVAVGSGNPPGTGTFLGLTSRYSPQGVRLSSQLAGPGPTNCLLAVDMASDGTLQSIGYSSDANNFENAWIHVDGPAGTHDHVFGLHSHGRSVLSLSPTDFLFTTSNIVAARYSGTSIVWSNPSGFGGFDTARDDGLAIEPSGVVFAAGNDGDQPALRRIRADGTTDWTVAIPGTDVLLQYTSGLTGLALDGQGSVFVTGTVGNAGSGRDSVVARIDATTGQILWNHTFDGGDNDDDGCQAIVRSANGDIYVVGYVSQPQIPARAMVRRYAPDGTLLGELLGPVTFRWPWQPRGLILGEDVWAWGDAPGPSGDSKDRITFVMRCDLALTRYDIHYDDSGWEADAELGPGRSIYIVGGQDHGAPTRRRILRIGTNSVAACFGDGSGTPCPCGNDSAPSARAGCLHSLGGAGKLDEDGLASITADTFVLEGSGMPDSPAQYFQGTTLASGGAGTPFGDGLRCATGSVVRFAAQQNVGGASQYPGPGDPPVSVRGAVSVPGTRTYQVWYRNVASFCTPAGFNLTNALLTTWEP